MGRFSITNECSHCYGSIVLLVSVSGLPDASGILTVLTEIIGVGGVSVSVSVSVSLA